MDFDFLTDQIVNVEKKKKTTTFTVREIGGPEEIKKWRQQQEAKEWAYRMRLGARDERLSSFEALTGQKLDRGKIKAARWDEKKAFAESERRRLQAQQEDIESYPPWEPEPEPKKTLFQKITAFFSRVWKGANF